MAPPVPAPIALYANCVMYKCCWDLHPRQTYVRINKTFWGQVIGVRYVDGHDNLEN